MIKKLIFLGLLLSATLVLFGKHPILAQEPPVTEETQSFDEAYSEYIKASQEYNSTHEDYVLKRAQYLRFQTLKSRQDAFDATLKMLQVRDDVVLAYLKAVKAKLNGGRDVPDASRESLNFRIDEEIFWFQDHKANIPSSGDLDDLVSDSGLARGRWQRVEPLAYETMSVLSLGKLLGFTDRTKEIFENTNNKIETIRGDVREGYSFSANKFSIFDRWTLEADGRIARSDERITETVNLIDKLASRPKDSQSQYNKIVSELSQSQIFLKEVNSFVKEVIKQIKTAEE